MTDGIATGWHHALWLLGYLIGLLPVVPALATLALLLWLVPDVIAEVRYWLAVRRVRRQARRSGRST